MRVLRIASELELPLETVTQAIGVLAKRRAGKSYCAAKLTEQMLGAGLQVVVVDPKGDWYGLRSSADGKSPGLPILILGGEHADIPLDVNAGEAVARFLVEQRVTALVDLSMFRKHELATFMAIFLETLYRLKAKEQFRTPMMLIIDEADAVAPQRPQKGEERMLGACEDIVRRGGQRGIGCLMATQRAAVLNKNVLTQIQILIALRTIAPQDLAALNDWIDVHGTPEQRRELMDSLPSLPVGTAWVWSPGWPDDEGIFQRVQVARRETFDSSATPKPGETRVEPRTLADVDLTALSAELASVVDKAKADDPKELRQRIAELERQLASRPAAEPVVERIEVPIVGAADVEALQRAAQLAQEAAASLNTAAERVATALSSAQRPSYTPPAVVQAAHDGLPRGVKTPEPADPRILQPASIAAGDITRPQQAILDALAEFEALGLPEIARSNVAVFADQSPRSSGFGNNLGRLRTNGLVDYPRGGMVALTEAGRQVAAMRGAFRSLEALHDAWYAKLPAPRANIVRALVDAYPLHMTRDDLARRVGQSATSSGYGNNLGGLRSLGLIDYPVRGAVAATELLFPAGIPRESASR
jgi:hypothetical protein